MNPTGITVSRNQHDIAVLRLHYSADPRKNEGKKVFVPGVDRELSPWAFAEYKKMTDPALYLREYEIEAEATLGALIFHLDAEATLEETIAIPQPWTRRMSLDPHPGVPHAFLWTATDPWGDRWYYRELWPSKVCFRYDNGRLIGRPGPCPDDDVRVTIKEYVEVLKYLESADNPENIDAIGTPFDEVIQARVIDYAARAFGKGTNDDLEQPNFQQRYEHYMMMPETRLSCPLFEDARKDHDVGFEMVNAGLKPREVMGNDGKYHKRSRIHILKDKCPELVYQLQNARRQQLTPTQAQIKDPTGRAVEVRMHQTDNIRYLEMANPIHIKPLGKGATWAPVHSGINY